MTDPDDNCNEPHISGNGKYIVFASNSTELVFGDTNGLSDVFIWDETGTGNKISRISVSTSGVQGNGTSFASSISPDGRYVAFESMADNLVSGDTNGIQDIFVRDRIGGTTIRVSVSSSGVQGDGLSYSPSISSDGQRVIFASNSTNLVPNDTNASPDIFLRDIQAGKTIRISVDKDGLQANSASYNPVFAANSPIAVFSSYASNLVSGDTNGDSDIFMRIFYP
jgi:Tol biopolymer transport system component